MAAVIWGTFAQFIWATIGEIFLSSYISAKKENTKL